jgi:hypothetical protein
MRSIVLALVLAACASSKPAPAPPAPAPPADPPAPDAAPAPPAGPKTDGTAGAVCAWGERSRPTGEQPEPCQAGLRCCYGCGTPGCNSVCMATQHCPAYP